MKQASETGGETATPTAQADAEDRSAVHGVLLMSAATLSIPAMDIMAKLLGPAGGPLGAAMGLPLAPLLISAARFIVQTVLVAPIALATLGAPVLAPRHLSLLIARGVLIALATVLFFTAIVYLSVAEAIAIFFVGPLILTLLSAFVLGERIGWRRILAVATGFAGALWVIQPNFIDTGWPALLPLGTAACFAGYLLLTKILSHREHPLTQHLWAGITGSALLGGLAALAAFGLAPASWGGGGVFWPISQTQAGLLLVIGVFATAGHFLVVMAFRRAPASTLAPLQYLEIVGAALLGWAILGESPRPDAWIGIAVIVASGLFVLHRERRAQHAG